MAGAPRGDADLRVAVIVGSTRPGRRAEAVARWVMSHVVRRDGIAARLVDLADHDLPLFDEPLPPIGGRYEHAHTRAWAETIAAFDAFVFVTPEYNHSIPAALKNAVDFLFDEWRDKAAGFVSYGVDAGGARAAEHLRVVLGELHVADVRSQVALSLTDDFEGYAKLAPRSRQEQKLDAMLDELAAWGTALRALRVPALAA